MSEPTRTSAPRTEEAMNTEEKARRMLEAAKEATPGGRVARDDADFPGAFDVYPADGNAEFPIASSLTPEDARFMATSDPESVREVAGALLEQKEELEKCGRVLWFAQKMEEIFRSHDGEKRGWDDIDADYAVDRMKEEVREIEDAMPDGFYGDDVDYAKLVRECADVANFCFMLAHKAQIWIPEEARHD